MHDVDVVLWTKTAPLQQPAYAHAQIAMERRFQPGLFSSQHARGYKCALQFGILAKKLYTLQFGMEGVLNICDNNSNPVRRFEDPMAAAASCDSINPPVVQIGCQIYL